MYNLRTKGKFVIRAQYTLDALKCVGRTNWIRIFFVAFFFTIYLVGEEPTPIEYVQAEEIATSTPQEVRIEIRIDWTRARIYQEIEARAKEYGTSIDKMWNTMLCENPMLDPKLQSLIVTDGIREDSWGLAQIHLPSHPHITKEQAQDPEFAIRFMASEFSEGRAYLWTCYRTLYKTR